MLINKTTGIVDFFMDDQVDIFLRRVRGDFGDGEGFLSELLCFGGCGGIGHCALE